MDFKQFSLFYFYFTACRSFTPRLAETYQILKEKFPSHGLEIVFVSFDRDEVSFRQYFASMPWLAIPFNALGIYKQIISATYGVLGIPYLVVLDSMSGQLVVPNTTSRQDIIQASKSGEEGISRMFQGWLGRVPEDSRQLLEMLKISWIDSQTQASPTTALTAEEKRYLIRGSFLEQQSQLKDLISQLVGEGLEEDEAVDAAKAVQAVSFTDDLLPSNLDCGSLQSVLASTAMNEAIAADEAISTSCCAESIRNRCGTAALRSAISVALKYLENCKKTPWATKFRSVQLSFKVADQITAVPGSIQLLQTLGFVIFCNEEDFVACIPVHADLDAMYDTMTTLLQEAQETSTTS
jgi:Thioredoxin-like/PUB domain